MTKDQSEKKIMALLNDVLSRQSDLQREIGELRADVVAMREEMQRTSTTVTRMSLRQGKTGNDE